MDTSTLVGWLRDRRSLLMPNESASTYEGLVTYLCGYDATSGSLLRGLSEFLQLKLGYRSNLVWWAIVPHLCSSPDAPDEEKISVLLDAVEELQLLFDRKLVFVDWYQLAIEGLDNDDLWRFGRSPVGDTLPLRDAVAESALDRTEFIGRAKQMKIRLGLRDGEAHIRRADIELIRSRGA